MAIVGKKFIKQIVVVSDTVFDSGGDIGLKLDAGSATSFSTTLSAGNPSASRTLTLPDGTDTLAGISLTQTLTNKTLALASNSLTGTASQVAIMSAGGILTTEAQLGPTRGGTGISNGGNFSYGSSNLQFVTAGSTVLTLPTSGTVATLTGSEVLTNKTISLNSNTLSGFTSGSVLFHNGTTIAQNNATFFWNNSTSRLCLGGSSASVGLDLVKDLALRSTTDSSTGNIDSLSTTDTSNIRLTGAAPALRGIAGGVDGKMLLISNVSGVDITVSNQDSNPTAANRIITGTNANIILKNGASMSLFWDTTTSRWRVVGLVGAITTSTLSLTTKTADYTVTTSDAVVVANKATTINITLPTASGITGQVMTIKNINVGNCIVLANGAETIDGAATIQLPTQWQSVDLISNGSNWLIL